MQCLHFIFDIKKPYLHNTFIFLSMLQLSVENHSITKQQLVTRIPSLKY